MARINKINEVHAALDEHGRIYISFVNGKIVDSRVSEDFDIPSVRKLVQGVSRVLVAAGYSPDLKVRNGTGYLPGRAHFAPQEMGTLNSDLLSTFTNALYERLPRIRTEQAMSAATA